MIAYIIKNNEGKYYKRYFDSGYVEFVDNICFAELYREEVGAEDTKDFILRNKYRFNIENLNIIRITISESDLDYENTNLNFKLKNYRRENKELRNQTYELIDKVFKLTKELEQKEREIESLNNLLQAERGNLV